MHKFIKTVAIVTVFSVFEKFLGFLYRIYLSKTIGEEGLGIYSVALSVFALLLTLSSSGTPITVSRLMTKYYAENEKEKAKKVISAGLIFTFLISLLISVVFFIFRDYFSFLFSDERCFSIFLTVLFVLSFNATYSVFRGVFWGNKDFLSYSIIELLEEICMIIVGVFLINNSVSVFDGTKRASIAVLVSYLFSFSLATALFYIRGGRLVNPKGQFKPLLTSALPITAMRTVNSLAISLVSIILPLRLVSAGYTNSEALSSFGAAFGGAIPILFIPTTLIGSFTLVLVPEIAENYYKKNYKTLSTDIEKAIKFASVLTFLFIPIFTVCGEEIGVLVFSSVACGKYLTYSSFIMIFMSLSSLSTSILNSIGKETKTLIFFIISSCFMLLSIYFLPKYLGIYALLVGFAFIYVLTTVLNLILLNKNCAVKPKYLKYLFTCLIITLPTLVFGFLTEKVLLPILGNFLTLLFSAMLMGVFFLCLAFILDLFNFDFLYEKFPFLKKIKLKRKKLKSELSN